MVFGGNCLHNFATEIQTTIYNIERRTTVSKYQLVGFTKLNWYAAKSLKQELEISNQQKTKYSRAKLEAAQNIYAFLTKESKSNKNAQDIPEDIKPAEFLGQLRKEIQKGAKFAKYWKFWNTRELRNTRSICTMPRNSYFSANI